MSDDACILAIDQGTTSSRAIVFNTAAQIVAVAQQEFRQNYPQSGWVEHDPEEIWASTLAVCREAIAAAEAKGARIAAIGVTNQRETTIVWDRDTGKPVYNAIVWQDRRTAERCRALVADNAEPEVQKRTGLLLDPYFSATKVAWILDQVEGARARAEAGDLAFGTVDSFLVWRLTGGAVHAADATNASRTSLYNIHTDAWDEELLRLFNVPESVLPDVRDSAGDYGETEASLFGRSIPLLGVCGDQQAATVGQACFNPGDIKSTYGTGAFVVLNTGGTAIASKNRLLTTVAYRMNGKTTYALEGSVFSAGSAIQWLRDGLGVIKHASDTEELARGLESNNGVYLVPAFTGLGAPHWDPQARGALFGLTRDAGPAEFARAAIESVCYQTRDLFDAMAEDGVRPATLKVDGGMAANDWMCAFLADILGLPVDRPQAMETTALGAAYLAGLKAGLFGSFEQIAKNWRREARFEPSMADDARTQLLDGWSRAVAATKRFHSDPGM
ncbi:MAG: glycerol kinase GlpK [Parvularculaceae bacterium]